jgi:hypothetical protein
MQQQDPPPILLKSWAPGNSGQAIVSISYLLARASEQQVILECVEPQVIFLNKPELKESQKKGHVRYAIIKSRNVMTPPLAEPPPQKSLRLNCSPESSLSLNKPPIFEIPTKQLLARDLNVAIVLWSTNQVYAFNL